MLRGVDSQWCWQTFHSEPQKQHSVPLYSITSWLLKPILLFLTSSCIFARQLHFFRNESRYFFLFLVIRKGLKDAWITTILTNFSQSVNYRNPDIVRLIRKASQNYYQKVTCAIFWVFHFFHLFLILKVQVAYGGACNEEKRQICNGTGSKWVIGL